MKRYANDPEYARIERIADLESKAALYHALKMVRQGPVRPVPKSAFDAWMMGRKAA